MRTVFLRVLEAEDKAAALLESIRKPHTALGQQRFEVDAETFGAMPGSPFAYWAPLSIVCLFDSLRSLKEHGYEAMTGAKTNDDPRFLRLVWEVPQLLIAVSREQTQGDMRWARITRGGPFSPFYYDMDSVIDWAKDGHCIKSFISEYRGRKGWGFQWSANLNGHDWYFLPGLTWPLRGARLSVWPVPQGCIPSGAGKMAYATRDHLPALLSILNSKAFDAIVRLFAGKLGGVQYEAGLLQQVLLPELSEEDRANLGEYARCAWTLKRSLNAHCENSDAFERPALLQLAGSSLAECAARYLDHCQAVEGKLATVHSDINSYCFDLYHIGAADRRTISEGFGKVPNDGCANADADSPVEDESVTNNSEATIVDTLNLVTELAAWALGVCFCRFDVRVAGNASPSPIEADPFAPLRTCPPGQLQNAQGLPARPEDVPEDYPIEIPWDGILVDDPGHALDIERRVREVIEIIWGRRVGSRQLAVGSEGKKQEEMVAETVDSPPATPESIEQEACEILGVRSLREYFQKPAKFFADHLKRYSKSRRQAPIYWPLSTESNGYTLWIYYHRLTDQILFHAVNNFVEPKLKQVTEELSRLKAKSGRSSAEEKELSKLTELASELTDFRDELLRVARFWKPNLNDGVLITASPLWKLFRLPKWRKDLKACWEELENGDYDWAHLALSIWPDRVVRTAHKDRSIAIAHDLETTLWHEVTVTKPGRGKNAKPTTKTEWQPKKLPEAELDRIVQQVKQRAYASS